MHGGDSRCLGTQCNLVLAGWTAAVPPVSAKVLSTRLAELTERGVVQRHVRDTSPPSVEYELTELGQELIPALDEIVKVGHKLKAKGHLPVKG